MRIGSVACLALIAGCSRPRPIGVPPVSAAARALAIADAVVADNFEQYPERPTMLRVPGVRYDALPDDSLAGIAAREAREAQWLAELRDIDPAQLGDGSAGGHMGPEHESCDSGAGGHMGPPLLAYLAARERLEALDGERVCRLELWTVSQMLNGWQVRFGNLAQLQPVGTDDLRRQALARFAMLPGYADAQTANLREGMRLGYTEARGTVRLVITQLDALIAMPTEQSPFFSPAARDGDPDFRAQLAVLVREQINPALRRHRDFLRDEYLPRARTAPGVSANPDGVACYRAAARYASTLDRSPEEIHRLGWQRLAAIEGRMQALSARRFGNAPVAELLARFKTDPRYRYRDAAQIMTQAQTSIDRAWAALPRAFGLLPTSPVILEPIPAYQERSAAPHYLPAALDGSRPAAYRVRLYQPTEQSWVIGESTAFHEVVPGHHLQIDIASTRAALPAIARFLFNSGYSEGWALYAEELSDELGLYSGDADRFGMLSNAAWRAVRMIVDTGIHTLGWDRQRAIDLLLAHTALSSEQAAAEVDRYIAWPGQAPSYMLGYLEIIALRADAEHRLGARFDLRAFHDRLLESGNVPLSVLRERITAWLSQPPAADG